MLISTKTGRLLRRGETPDVRDGTWIPVKEAEPYFSQFTGSDAIPRDRVEDGRFDTSHLSPAKAWRIGRDYIAHAIRYGWPLNVIRERFQVGARIIEFGCGEELPMFRTLTCDHSAMVYYKPSRYVGIDLGPIKYNPNVTGISSVIKPMTNIVTDPNAIPDEVFDIVVSFEVIEHMGKDDGLVFIDKLVSTARRSAEREGRVGCVLVSTPVNGGKIAKNHIYEWNRGELRRAFEQSGATVLRENGTFSNLRDLLPVLSDAEMAVWNTLVDYHSPHVLSAVFSANHPEAARNIAWLLEVR